MAGETGGAAETPPEPPKDCLLCPRLVAYRRELQAREPGWFNGAAPSFGDPGARLLVVGLAPGAGGANRTGRPFTGDWAGELLYATLADYGFANGLFDARPDDGLELFDCMVTNAVRCVPPQNKPTGAEVNTCRRFLEARIEALPELRAVVCLGRVSHDSVIRALGGKLKDHGFAHGAEHKLGGLRVFDSYHCSRYNTNTGRLTEEMFRSVFARVRAFVDG
ncbi:MAG: uracil-DNA glycosylase [Pseudomonadota bacterium]